MPFDISTARPIEETHPKKNGGFDISTARPLTEGTDKQFSGNVPTIETFKRMLPTKETFKRMLPTKKEIPELLATTLAGLKASKLGTLPAAGAVGTAGLAAEIGKQIAEPFRENPQIPKPEEALFRQAMAFGRGAGGELGGRFVGKLFSPFASSITPEIAAQRTAGESIGMKPPLSTMTSSPFVAGSERIAEYVPFVGGAITKQKENALRQFGEYSLRVGKEIGVDRPPELTGNLAKEAAKGFKESFNSTKDKLYEIVEPHLKNQPLDSSLVGEKIEQIISRRSGEAEPSGINQLRNWLIEIKSSKPNLATLSSGKTSSISTFGELRKFRTNLGQRTKFEDPALSGLKSDLLELYATVSNVLDESAKTASPEIYSALKQADRFYAQGKGMLKSKIYNQISKTNPENIHKIFIKPNANELVEIGKEILGEDTFRDVQRQWYNDVLRTSTNPDGTLSPVKLSKKLTDYGSTIDVMFKENFQISNQIKKLKDISLLLSRGRGITKGSQTAYLATTFGTIAGNIRALIMNPVAGLKILGETALGIGLTGGMLTPVGREYLTRGFPKIGQTASRLAQPSIQLGLQKYERPFAEEITAR